MELFQNKKSVTSLLDAFGRIKDASYDFTQIEKYFIKKDHPDSSQVISDKVCNDLDFQELFMFVDRTTSPIGQQFLFDSLRTIPRQPHSYEKILTRLSNDKDFRIRCQLQLQKIEKKGAYHIQSLFQDEYIQQPPWFPLVLLLASGSLMSVIMIFIYPKFLLLFLAIL